MVPKDTKIARISTTFKANDKTEMSNYRPISVFFFFQQSLKKNVWKNGEFLTKYNILVS